MPLVRRGYPNPQPTPIKSRKSPIRIQDPEHVLQSYVTWHEAEGHSHATETCYQRTLRPLFSYLKTEHEITDLNQVGTEHLRAWLVWLRNTPTPHGHPRSSKTLESYCRQATAFFRWCYAESIIDHDPTDRLRLPKAEKKHSPFPRYFAQ